MAELTEEEKQQLLKATGINTNTQKEKSPKCMRIKKKRPL